MKPFDTVNKIVYEVQDKKEVKAYIPINKGQFTLETPEREELFDKNRGFDDPEGYKEYRRQWYENPKEFKQNDYPLHVDIELASICNLKCPMCYTVTQEFKTKVNTKLMHWDLYTKIIDEIGPAGVYSIRLSLRGESFLHKRIIDAVKYAKDKGIKEVSTLTNGVKLDEEMFKKIMEAGIDWITISADGIGEVYEKIRQPAKFDRLLEKLKNFQSIKREANRLKPVIKIQSVLPAIENNVDAFYSAFAPISDLVSSNPLIDFHESKADLPKINNFVCPQIFQRLVVGADGLVMMCANDEVGSHPVGDANNESIKSIWLGDKMNEVRKLHRAHKAIHSIEACQNCYLPLKTFEEEVKVDGRSVIAAKYQGGKEKVKDLHTPEKYQREGLDV